MIYEPDRGPTLQTIQQALASTHDEFETEFRIRLPDGRMRWVLGQGRVFRDATGTPLRMVGIGLEITRRKRQEEAEELLAGASAALSSSLDHTAAIRAAADVLVPRLADLCAVDVVDRDGRLRRVALATALGEGAVAPDLAPDYAPGDPRNEILRTGAARLLGALTAGDLAIFARTEDERAQFEALDPTSALIAPLCAGQETLGVMLLVAVHGSRRYDEHDAELAEEIGRRAGTAILNARAYQQSQEAAAALARANQAKDEFLGLVSHELRTPLTTIAGNADALLRLHDRMERGALVQALTDIKSDTVRLTRLMENMLLLSKLELEQEMELEPVILERIAEATLQHFRALYPKREFILIAPPVPPLALGQPACLEQVLLNLLSNATKYSPAEAPIEIRVEVEGSWVAVTVADRGVGIAEPERIFDPFYRSGERILEVPGLGLGLAVCRRLMTLQKGTIAARSREGGGAEFTFRVPHLAADE